MVCVPIERGPLGPWQLELALDVSVISQEPSLWRFRVSATVLVTTVAPSSCHMSLSVAAIEEGSRRVLVTWTTLEEQLKVDGANVMPPALEPMFM